MPESYGISVSRYVVPAARNMETARSIDRSRSEFKVGHAANCNKYPARARAARLNCMRNNVSDIYRYPFSSFESDLYPAPGSRSYIFHGTAVRNKQQATTLLQVTPLILACPSHLSFFPLQRKTGIGSAIPAWWANQAARANSSSSS